MADPTPFPESHSKKLSHCKTFCIQNAKGLHARAAAKFVTVVNSFSSEVKVTRVGGCPNLFEEQRDYWAASGGSVLGILTLGAEKGAKISVEAHGDDAEQVLAALEALINNKFDEAE